MAICAPGAHYLAPPVKSLKVSHSTALAGRKAGTVRAIQFLDAEIHVERHWAADAVLRLVAASMAAATARQGREAIKLVGQCGIQCSMRHGGVAVNRYWPFSFAVQSGKDGGRGHPAKVFACSGETRCRRFLVRGKVDARHRPQKVGRPCGQPSVWPRRLLAFAIGVMCGSVWLPAVDVDQLRYNQAFLSSLNRSKLHGF